MTFLETVQSGLSSSSDAVAIAAGIVEEASSLASLVVLLVFVGWLVGRRRKRKRKTSMTTRKRSFPPPTGSPVCVRFDDQSRIVRNAEKFYAPKKTFCTDAECKFLKSLERACAMNGWKVFPKVQIRELCYQRVPKEASSDGMLAWNLVKMKHVDFLVCDADYKPIAAVEYDDWSHSLADPTMRSDEFKNAFFAAIGLPLVRFLYGHYTPEVLAERLAEKVREA